jgi:hypothetical protein
VSDKETNINNIGGNNKYNERMIHGVVTSGDRMHACSIRSVLLWRSHFPKKDNTMDSSHISHHLEYTYTNLEPYLFKSHPIT